MISNKIEIAKQLFLWNTRNLVQSADLKKSEIGQFFADSFQVKANGRQYDADHDNYFEFLNQFRSTIRSIHYDFHDLIEAQASVVMAHTAHIVRVQGERENFEAILILKFNKGCRIVLWHEVYVNV